MRLTDLEHSRIAILGAGREGQATYAWLRTMLPTSALTVIAEAPPDPVFVEGLRQGDQMIVEPLSSARLQEYEVLIRSPGISIYREPLRRVLDAGVRITTPSNLWFAAHPDAKTICITGTKGKSTTSALLGHLLQAGGYQVRLAGNIGLPLLACDDQGIDWWVIELSSYQIADLVATPTMVLILNFSPEHLDWHGGEDVYRQDKLRLAALAKQGIVILNASDPELLRHFPTAPNVSWFNTDRGIHVVDGQILHFNLPLPVKMPVGLPGRHNLLNTAAALTAVAAVGLDPRQAAAAVETFKSLPHRLQFLGQHNGVDYINDSIATTPVATVAALEALRDRQVILILGGLDRGLDWSRHAGAFLETPPKAVIGLPNNGVRIIDTLSRTGVSPVCGFNAVSDLQAAVALAKELAAQDDTILLSPGAPSQPQFIDFRHRGQSFAQLCGFEKIVELSLPGYVFEPNAPLTR